MFCGDTARASRSESSLEVIVKSLLRLAKQSKGNCPWRTIDQRRFVPAGFRNGRLNIHKDNTGQREV
jgi:hypothetical protein